jgi:hypothetical protein
MRALRLFFTVGSCPDHASSDDSCKNVEFGSKLFDIFLNDREHDRAARQGPKLKLKTVPRRLANRLAR